MGNKVKINLYIDEEVDVKIEELAKATIRGKNDVITWLVGEAWKKYCAGSVVEISQALSVDPS